jgi:Ca2+/H+ antiporter
MSQAFVIAGLTLVTAVVVLATAVVSLVMSFRTHKRVGSVEHTVNSATDVLNDRIDQLTESLTVHGIDVPPRERNPNA